ncbi:carbohydrate kinase family protein [Deltaproteobacteria bacterium Smac51]|nr:carbohydrate kinase family protein [Deltaproteobacteria bacterium Smac51]
MGSGPCPAPVYSHRSSNSIRIYTMSIACFGSLAFDRLMSYPGRFSDHLIADKLDQVSLSLLVDKVKRVYGGTAGNIGYNLQLLGEKPYIIGSLGDDPDGQDYADRIKGWGLPLDGVKLHSGQMTAGCVIASDENNSQFTFFHPGAMNLPSGFDLGTLAPGQDHLVIISPAGADEMRSLAADCRRLGLKFIFDPGQQIPALGKEGLLEALEEAHMLICNEYELNMFQQSTELSLDEIFSRTEVIVMTKGAAGSDLLVHGRGSQHIMAVPVRVLGSDPTGAGDAFRAGLLKGLAMGEHLITACRLGATVAAFRVEGESTQSHTFTLMEVMGRHASAFNEQVNLIK